MENRERRAAGLHGIVLGRLRRMEVSVASGAWAWLTVLRVRGGTLGLRAIVRRRGALALHSIGAVGFLLEMGEVALHMLGNFGHYSKESKQGQLVSIATETGVFWRGRFHTILTSEELEKLLQAYRNRPRLLDKR